MKYLDGLTLIESILLWLLANKTKLPYHPRKSCQNRQAKNKWIEMRNSL